MRSSRSTTWPHCVHCPRYRSWSTARSRTGPLLRSLLDDAGVDPSATVHVVGAGIRDEGRLTLTARQVDRDVQLDFSERGTAKVCSAWLDRGEWVRDVISIDAQ